MIIVLMGAPGAGKGTQADLLIESGKYRKISTGDVLRKHIKMGTQIGKNAESIIAQGKLVPDDVLLEILRQELGSNEKEVIILDGYPRNVAQAKTLQSLSQVHRVKGAVVLDVEREELIARISGRRVCQACGATFHVSANPPKTQGKCDKCGGMLIQRPDDVPEKVRVRLDVFDKETKPVIDFYNQMKSLTSVSADGSKEEIYKALKKAVESLSSGKN